MMTCDLNTDCERWLARAFFAVEATSFEQHALWANHCIDTLYPRRDHKGGLVGADLHWEQLNPGGMVTIGQLDGRPVNLSLTFARIEGRIVLFWFACSQVTDSVMADAWLAKTFDPKRRATCDANNFNHCIHAIEAANAAEVVT